MNDFISVVSREKIHDTSHHCYMPSHANTAWPHAVRAFLLFLFMLCTGFASAQQVEVMLTEAGTLPKKITSDQKYAITSLKNGTDVRYLRDMAGRNYEGNVTDGKLVDLDLTDASIVEGGRFYYSFSNSCDVTENNVIGCNMFCNCKLESIKLPRENARNFVKLP